MASPRARGLLPLSLLPMAAGLLLRVPSIAEPVGIDQGIFLTAGWGLQRGLSLYRDLWDQKPPGIHLIYLRGLVVSGDRVSVTARLDILAAAATTVLLFDLGRRRIGWSAGVIAGTAYAWLTVPAAIYNFGGFLERAVPETFVVLLVTVSVWLAAALAGGLANGVRVFNSYFIPAQPALALMIGTLAAGAREPSKRWRTLVMGGAVTLVAVGVGWRGHIITHLAAATDADVRALVSGRTDSPEYLDRFGGFLDARGYSARANAELASWIRGHAAPADRIYIFGMAPSVYFLSQRLPSNRFLFVYPPLSGYVARPAFTLEGFAADLARVPPRVLVLDGQDRDSRSGWRAAADFDRPPIQAILEAYDLQAAIGNFRVYVRRR